MIKCSECGYENIDGLDYCDGCGAKLAAAEEAGAQPAEAPEGKAEAAAEAAAPAEGAASADEAAPEEPAAEAAATAQPAAEAPASEAPTGEIKPAEEAEAAPAEFKAKLVIVRGGRKGQEFPLEGGNNLIGRWDPETGAFPEVDLEQDDPEAKVSRRHALIRIEGGKITGEDIGSLNGTYVNRQPRLQPGTPVDLKTGDEIIVGKTFLKLVVEPIS